jgi:hypothetical protein
VGNAVNMLLFFDENPWLSRHREFSGGHAG